jgi:hypothetical protein
MTSPSQPSPPSKTRSPISRKSRGAPANGSKRSAARSRESEDGGPNDGARESDADGRRPVPRKGGSASHGRKRSAIPTAGSAAQTAAHYADRMESAAIQQLHAHPYGTLAAAVGVGFVLGGGLSSRIGRFAMKWAFKSLARTVTGDWLRTLAELGTM